MVMPQAAMRLTSKILLLVFVTLSGLTPMARAGMIGTEQLLDNQTAQSHRDHLHALLARADLAAQLQAAGVDAQQLRGRLDALTDTEVAALDQQLAELPAGGDILSTAVFIFLVLLITDILGYTDVFPFVKKTIK
jgi:hypothetical protein